jgi:hypothetical protein
MFHTLTRLLARLRRPAARAAAVASRRAAPRLEKLESRAVPGSIGGAVYNDLNLNGLLDPGEPGYLNNPISLLNAAGQTIATTTTDANGHYLFSVNQTVSTAPAVQEVDAHFGSATTSFTQTQSIAQFDPSLGTLTSVEVVQAATLTSHIQAESLDAAASQVQGQVGGGFLLQGPGGLSLTNNVTTDQEQAQVAAFDGAADLKGASAVDFGAKTASGAQSLVLNASTQDLSGFIGKGVLALTESAQAQSSASGPGNLLAMISSTAAADVKIIYHYTPSTALAPGQYTVVQTANPPGTVDTANTADNVTTIPAGSPEAIPVVLPAGGDSLNNNFGETAAPLLAPPDAAPPAPTPPAPTPPAPVPAPAPAPAPAPVVPAAVLSKREFLSSNWSQWGG